MSRRRKENDHHTPLLFVENTLPLRFVSISLSTRLYAFIFFIPLTNVPIAPLFFSIFNFSGAWKVNCILYQVYIYNCFAKNNNVQRMNRFKTCWHLLKLNCIDRRELNFSSFRIDWLQSVKKLIALKDLDWTKRRLINDHFSLKSDCFERYCLD